MEKKYLTLPETAELLSIPEKSLRAMVAPSSQNKLKINGQIVRPSRINRRLRFDRVKIEKLMASN